MRRITTVLPHVSIVLSGMLATFFVIDRFNSAMRFMGNEGTKWLVLALSLSAVACAILLIASQRREARDTP